jgi:hypothetical protein
MYCLVMADIDDMKKSPKKQKRVMQDCRECSFFRWDFESGRFLCENAKDYKVEELHLIPYWCPLADTGTVKIAAKDKLPE